MLNFTFLGHACVLIQSPRINLITDPWFGYPFHYDAYVSKYFIRIPSEEVLSHINVIHISHIHKDHFCKKSLEHFNKSTPVVIAKYSNPKLREKVEDCGFKNIIEIVPHSSGVDLEDINIKTFTPLVEDGSFNSSMMVTFQGDHYYFMNDCSLSREQNEEIKKLYNRIKGGFFSIGHINPFPFCYEVILDQKNSHWKKDKINQLYSKNINELSTLIEMWNVEWAINYANDLRFSYPINYSLNSTFEEVNDLKLLNNTIPFLCLNYGDQINTEGQLDGHFDKSNQIIYDLQNEKTVKNCVENLKYQNLFFDLLSRNCSLWTEDMTIEFKILNSNEKYFYLFSKTNKTIESLTSDQQFKCDLSIEYSPNLINKVLLNNMTFRDLHFAYGFRAYIHRNKGRQLMVHQWV